MTDRDAFLKTILARPAEDGPRLVFCDYLEEQGEGEYAEFIRVQIELFGLKDPQGIHWLYRIGRMPPCGCRHCVLRRRERELLRHWCEWSHPCRSGSPREKNIVPEFQRGFVYRVSLPWEEWLAHESAMRAAQPITAVTLTTTVAVRFSPPERRTHSDLYDSVVTTYSWTAECDGLSPKRFATSYTLARGARPRIASYHGGILLADMEHARTVKGYLEAVWPGITFTLPDELTPAHMTPDRLLAHYRLPPELLAQF